MIRRWWRWLWWGEKEWNNDDADGISISSIHKVFTQCRRCSYYLANLLLLPCQKVSRQGREEKKRPQRRSSSNNKHKIYQLAALETKQIWKGNRLRSLRADFLTFVIDFSDGCMPSVVSLGAPAAQLMFQISHFNSIHDNLKRQQATGKWRTTTTVAAPWAAADFLLLLLLRLRRPAEIKVNTIWQIMALPPWPLHSPSTLHGCLRPLCALCRCTSYAITRHIHNLNRCEFVGN